MLAKPSIVDLSIHGIVTVRLIDPEPRTTAALRRQLAAALRPGPADPDPDIIVRFSDKLAPAKLNYLGTNSVGFSDDGFYTLDKTTGSVEARIPFDSIGEQCEIVCNRGATSIPLFEHIINFTFLKKEYVPLHASAFVHDGTGFLAMGWPKGGKTGVMLSFINQGARYIGDEWVLVSSDGGRMLGLPWSVSVSQWQFQHIPRLMPKLKVNWQRRLFFKSIHLLDYVQAKLQRGRLAKSFAAKTLRKALPSLRKQLKVSKPPGVIFEDHVGRLEATPDKILLTISHDQAETRVERCDPMLVVSRMVHANRHEQGEFLDYYTSFRFAFPERRNEFLEKASDTQDALLRRALRHREAYQVFHAYGGPLNDLFEELRAATGRAGPGRETVSPPASVTSTT